MVGAVGPCWKRCDPGIHVAPRAFGFRIKSGVSVFDCQGLLGGWGVVFHPRGSPASYGVQLQK